MRSDFEKAFKKEYPHADYLACLKFDEVENQYKPINEEVEPPDVNFWVCVGVNTGWWAWQYRQTEVDDLQKRVDELQAAFKQLIEMENESISFEHDLFDKGWNQSARQTIENIYKLTGLGEQALKGGSND